MKLPLEGCRIVGFSHIGAAPYALSLLGDMGADVINIEPTQGDSLRTRDSVFPRMSAYFLAINRNKRAVALNLKDDAGHEAALRLALSADVIVENYRVGALDALGFGYEALRARKPELVYCSISPWGRKGPIRDVPGMDLLAQARGGMMGLNGEPGHAPVRIPPPVADFISTYLACFGIVLALRARDELGVGQRVDVSLLGGQVATMANLVTYFAETGRPNQPVGSAHPQLVPYQPFLAADGYFIVACLTEGMWLSLCDALDRKDLAADPRFSDPSARVVHRAELLEILEPIFATEPMAHWLELLAARDVPAGPIHTLADVLSDPQVHANGYVREIEHPTEGHARIAGSPLELSEAPFEIRRHAAAVGEHTREVLTELGYTSGQIDDMFARGVAAGDALPDATTPAAEAV